MVNSNYKKIFLLIGLLIIGFLLLDLGYYLGGQTGLFTKSSSVFFDNAAATVSGKFVGVSGKTVTLVNLRGQKKDLPMVDSTDPKKIQLNKPVLVSLALQDGQLKVVSFSYLSNPSLGQPVFDSSPSASPLKPNPVPPGVNVPNFSPAPSVKKP